MMTGATAIMMNSPNVNFEMVQCRLKGLLIMTIHLWIDVSLCVNTSVNMQTLDVEKLISNINSFCLVIVLVSEKIVVLV